MFKRNRELDLLSKELCKFRIINQANISIKNRENSIDILANYQSQNLSQNLSQPNRVALNFM